MGAFVCFVLFDVSVSLVEVGGAGVAGAPGGEGGVVDEGIDLAGDGLHDILLEEGLLNIPHRTHIGGDFMTKAVETPDAVVACLLLQARSEVAAAPDAAATDAEMLVGDDLVGHAVEEEEGTGCAGEAGCSALADDAAGKAHHALEGEVVGQFVGVSVGQGMGAGK